MESMGASLGSGLLASGVGTGLAGITGLAASLFGVKATANIQIPHLSHAGLQVG